MDLGYAIGRLVRELRSMPRMAAVDRLVRRHALEPAAAEILLRYLDDQAASGGVPDDRTIVIERSRDDLGDWRVCLLSPLGSRIHAPWAMAASAEIRRLTGADVHVMWGDEGFVVRFPATDEPPDPMLLCRLPIRSSAWSSASSRLPLSSRRASVRPPLARCSFPVGGPESELRCGNNASAPRICSPSRRAMDPFRPFSRPIARFFATISICLRSSRHFETSRRTRYG